MVDILWSHFSSSCKIFYILCDIILLYPFNTFLHHFSFLLPTHSVYFFPYFYVVIFICSCVSIYHYLSCYVLQSYYVFMFFITPFLISLIFLFTYDLLCHFYYTLFNTLPYLFNLLTSFFLN